MIRKEFYCGACDMIFERTVIDQNEEEKCPCCGGKDIELKKQEEKKADSCGTSAKYT